MADTHVAASCSYADVIAANALCASGDTLSIPAGSATWAGNIIWTIGINVIGAGEGQTVITGAYTGHSTSTSYLTAASYLIAYVPANPALDEPFRLSGITFDFGGVSHGLYLKNGTTSPITKVRIDHCNMSNSYGNANLLLRHGTVYGVADNCTFDGGFFMFKSFGLNATTWNNIAFNYGGRNFYFEDCDITCTTMCIEGGLGGEYALRHNNITILTGTGGLFDIHGNAANHATLGVEVYENDINTGTRGGNILDHRGGMALCYNNNITSTGSWFNKVREEYLDSITPPANNAVTGQPQHVSSSYYWGNRKNGTTLVNSSITGTVDYGGSIGLVPQWGVDCWRETVPFTGASGEVGTGLLVARPSSGLSVGVGYWATDTQTLYRATSATTWQAYYTPYTYPHPLREESYPEPGDPTILTTSSASFAHAATSPTLIPAATYSLVIGAAGLLLEADGGLELAPIEPTPWDIKLGPLGDEFLLPLLNWPVGSSPEMPAGATAYIDSVPLSDGTVRHNFRTYSPRKWTFEWARLTAAQVAVFNELVAHNEPLHFQNKWMSADWHWVIITACDPVPLTTTFTTGTPFWKLTLELEEIL